MFGDVDAPRAFAEPHPVNSGCCTPRMQMVAPQCTPLPTPPHGPRCPQRLLGVTPPHMLRDRGQPVPFPSRQAPSCPPRRQRRVLIPRGGEPWCRAGGGMPVDMFGQGPGRGPGLSHRCWVHRRGTVQRQGKPAATAGVLGSWVTGGGFLSNRPSRALPSSTVLPPGLSPEIIPVLSSRKCRGKA